MLDIVSAIRKLCEVENGFVNLFKDESKDALNNICSNKDMVRLFSKLVHGKARNSLIELINDSYQYEKYGKQVIEDLIKDGLTVDEASIALEIFYKVFGYPGYRQMENVSEFVSYETDKFKCVHKGETIDGIEYGVGIRNNYYEGKSCGWDECVWINGKMLGYCHSLEIEFEAYETKKYGFVLNDTYVGKYMTIYEDGTEEYMYGMALNID